MSSLVAYSASAGSGKTYRITREYLKLILHPKSSLRAYRHVLAVTFTNKATEEMKTRILLELNDLANGEEKKLSDLCAEFQENGVEISPVMLQQRALEVRGNLLHDYARFSVLTIDKFFQKVLQAFVRDAGLQPGFEVELDTGRLIEEAADAVLENAEENKQRRQWLWQLVEQRIESGKSWDAKKSLVSLGRELFGEHFQQLDADMRNKLNNKDFLQDYWQKMQGIITSVDKKLQDIAQQAKQYMQQQGLTEDDFKGKKKGFIFHFEKILKGTYTPTATTLNAVNEAENWTAKGTDSAAKDAYHTLNPLLAEVCQYWAEGEKDYNTAKLILKNFMQLGLLADMAQQVQSIIRSNNILPLSNATRLISGLISDSEAPFIYEKLGNTYRSFMIDEFQDTSQGQWSNFLPLVKNSLSENHLSMVVGDVKQSIYRWRNGDWRILAYGIDHDLQNFGAIERKPLKDNWRSLPNIVWFNNIVFEQVVVFLQKTLNNNLSENLPEPQRKRLLDMFPLAYTDAEQCPKRKEDNGGFVRLNFVAEDEENTAQELILAQLPLLIETLQTTGYGASDIAVLVRDKRDGQAVADTLIAYKKDNPETQYCFDVISQDTLQLNSSLLVRLCIALLRMATGQENSINETFLQHEIAGIAQKTKQDATNLHRLFAQTLPAEEKSFLFQLTLCSLPEAFEQMVQRYKLYEVREELPFLQALFDMVIQFSNQKMSDISAFLQWWDERGKTQSLPGVKGQNAITISTIHKSKGLQYKVVLLPFCDWDLDTKNATSVWMHNGNAPFDAIEQLPLPYGQTMSATIFDEQYSEEKAQAYIDSLNLLYVALTRAEEQLYIFAPIKKTTKEPVINKISQVLQGVFTEDNVLQAFEKAKGKRINEDLFEFGNNENALPQKQADKQNAIVWNLYISHTFLPRLRINRNAALWHKSDEMSGANYGNFMHKIFERITTIEDANEAVLGLYNEGLLPQNEIVPLQEKVQKALQQPGIAAFFSSSWTVHNEAQILLPAVSQNGFLKRPDRVMTQGDKAVVLDYKFGKQEDKKHEEQIAQYMQSLQQMGYREVQGYVWYVELSKLTTKN